MDGDIMGDFFSPCIFLLFCTKRLWACVCTQSGFPGGSEVKASACNAGDQGLIPGLGRSPGEGNDNPLQYSCLENPMDGGVWWATLVHGVANSRTWLSNFTSLYALSHSVKSDSLQPHGLQSILCPWDFSGKNTGVGCHFLFQCMKVRSKSEATHCVRLPTTPWTAAHQAPPSMGFSRQEYWSGVPLPSLHWTWGTLYCNVES